MVAILEINHISQKIYQPTDNLDLDDEDKVQECTKDSLNNAIGQLTLAIEKLSDTKVDRTLYNNLWTTEIKSLDDTIRFTMNINVALMAAYSAFITINANTIFKILSSFTADSHLPFSTKYYLFDIPSFLNTTIFIFSIILPIIFWVASLKISCMYNHHLPHTRTFLDEKETHAYLIEIINKKTKILWSSYFILINGVLYIVLFVLLILILNTKFIENYTRYADLIRHYIIISYIATYIVIISKYLKKFDYQFRAWK